MIDKETIGEPAPCVSVHDAPTKPGAVYLPMLRCGSCVYWGRSDALCQRLHGPRGAMGRDDGCSRGTPR
jgi:hypothetical protein